MKHRATFRLSIKFPFMLEFWFSPEVSLAIQRVVIIVFKYLCHTVPAFDRCLSINCPCRCRFDLGSTCGTTAPKCWRGRRGSHHYAAGSRSANISRLSFTRAKDSLRIDYVCPGSCFQQMTAISPWYHHKSHSTRGTTMSKDRSCWWSNVFRPRPAVGFCYGCYEHSCDARFLFRLEPPAGHWGNVSSVSQFPRRCFTQGCLHPKVVTPWIRDIGKSYRVRKVCHTGRETTFILVLEGSQSFHVFAFTAPFFWSMLNLPNFCWTLLVV